MTNKMNQGMKNSAKKKNSQTKKSDPLEPLKMEIAAELGLIDQVMEEGWHSLSARDAGRIGGIMAQRRIKANNTKGSNI